MNKSRMMPAVLAVAVVVAFLTTGCIRWSTQSRPVVNGPAAAEFAVALRNRVSTDAMMAHLSKLQDIANANDGTRAVGIGSGAWDYEGRESWVRLDRVLDVPEESIRREGAILEREVFDVVAARLRADYAWR